MFNPLVQNGQLTAHGPQPGYHTAIGMPMGFAAQLRAAQETQRKQAERITNLEQENAMLKSFKDSINNTLARIEALEQQNAYLAARRREAVSQLHNLRTLHQEADNAFQMRTVDMQPDDLEGMLCAYGTMVSTAMNLHQRTLGQMRVNGQLQHYMAPLPRPQYPPMPVQYHHAYPPAYSPAGYCYAHRMPYCCRICSNTRDVHSYECTAITA